MEYSKACIAAYELQKLEAATASSNPTVFEATPAAIGDTAAINEIADVTRRREVPVMSFKDYGAVAKLFHKLVHRMPLPYEIPSREQMSVPLDILKRDSCFVDWALWVGSQGRIAKKMRGVGMLIGLHSPKF